MSSLDSGPGVERQGNPLETSREPAGANSIVVGHDGSPNAAATLSYALELAEKLGAPVTVVKAWTVDHAPHGTLIDHGYVSSFREASQKIRDLLISETMDAVAARPSVDVSYRAALGQAAAVLIDVSAGSRMLVVGSRGRGGFASHLLGSVSEHCVQHARCPVLVYRHSDAVGRGGR